MWEANFKLLPFYLPGLELRYQLNSRPDRPQNWCGCFEENSRTPAGEQNHNTMVNKKNIM
jgi:hypothetical protein